MPYEVEITRLAQEAIFDLRFVSSEPASQFTKWAGVELEINRLIGIEHLQWVRLGPRRVMIKSALEHEQQIEQKLLTTLSDTHRASVVNVSDYYLGIRIGGENAPAVLAHAVPLDLHDFAPGNATATVVFSVGGLLICEQRNCYAVWIERSYFDYIWQRFRVCSLA